MGKIPLGKQLGFFYTEALTLDTLTIATFADLVCGLLWLLKYLLWHTERFRFQGKLDRL